jgi:hypothetical protein
LVVVAGAQAADLPTKKGAPVAQYVKICNIGGVAGFVIPGSDTCLKISGTNYAMAEAGNLSQQYLWNGVVLGKDESSIVRGANTNTRDDIGWYDRFNLAFDAANNTAYGVLSAHIDINFNIGSGFNSPGGYGNNVNHAYIQWAGFTAGVHNSYFSFFGGGEGWEDTMSADRQGFDQPNLFAYTATFGGGFSATVSIEDRTSTAWGAASGPWYNGSTAEIAGNSLDLGQRAPDIVGAIDLVQGWGGAHLAVVAHNVNLQDQSSNANTLDTWGWAIDGGVKVNLPSIGAGDNIQVQGSWSENAIWYSGVLDSMNGELGQQVNGNGLEAPYADAYSNGLGTWATPTAWSIEAIGEFHFSPTFFIGPEIAYGQVNWSNNGFGVISSSISAWQGGAVFHWDPVQHLDFALELLYQDTHQSVPTAFVAGTAATCAAGGICPWKGDSQGGVARLMVTRDF